VSDREVGLELGGDLLETKEVSRDGWVLEVKGSRYEVGVDLDKRLAL
jgi:hypothetical protein